MKKKSFHFQPFRVFILSTIFSFTFMPPTLTAQDIISDTPIQLVCSGFEEIPQSCIQGNPGTSLKCVAGNNLLSQLITGADPVLLPPPLNLTTPQFVLIDGLLTIDKNYTFSEGSELIFTKPQSGIVINSTITLTCIKTYLHGCRHIWKGVEVKAKGSVILKERSKIEDAFRGVSLNPNSTINSNGTQFNGNHTCIYAGGPGFPNQHPITSTIVNNGFFGSKALIEVFYNPFYPPGVLCPEITKPFYGIHLENVKAFSVGAGGSGGQDNVFADFKAIPWDVSGCLPDQPNVTGIRSIYSNLHVSNSRFRNFDKDSGGKGVRFTSRTVIPSQLDFIGLGNLSSAPTFQNMELGIVCDGGFANISQSYFDDLIGGINYKQEFGDAPGVVEITNNTFNNISTMSISIVQEIGLHLTTITKNRFYDNGLALPEDLLPRAGIYLATMEVIPFKSPAFVYDNYFTNEYKPLPLGFTVKGIWVRGVEDALIEKNSIIDNYGISPNLYTGVHLFKGSSALWNNNMDGAGNFSSHKSVAYQIEDSPSWLSCNAANQTKVGIELINDNDGSTITKNVFNTHETGLLYRKFAVSGYQTNFQNEWNGNSSNYIEALFEGRDPSNIVDLFFVSRSPFFVHTSNMTSAFWPLPRLIGTVSDNQKWFKTGEASNIVCIATAPNGGGGGFERTSELTSSDEQIINGSYQPIGGFKASLMEAQINLFIRLSDKPELAPEGSLEITWKNAFENTAAGRLASVYYDLMNLHQLDPLQATSFDQLVSTRRSTLNALWEKSLVISTDFSDTEVPASLLLEKQALEVNLSAIEHALEQENELRNASRSTKALQLQTELAGILTETAYESDFKTILELSVSGLLIQNTNQTEIQNIRKTIAHKCRYSGGLAVILSRASLLDEWNWDEYDSCVENNDRSLEGYFSEVGSRIYPNPAQNSATLELDATIANGWVELCDINGRIQKVWSLTNQRQISLQWGNNMPNGQYVIKIFNEQGLVKAHRLSIHK